MAAASRKVKYTALEALRSHITRKQKSSIFAFKDQLTLVSYIAKHNNCVLALSSMHDHDNVESDDRKPEITLYYNATKSDIDNSDHLSNM